MAADAESGALTIEQPGAPNGEQLVVPAALMPRFELITGQFGDVGPLMPQFIGAAVLVEGSWDLPDKTIMTMARQLAVADKLLHEGDKIPILTMGQTSLEAGMTRGSSGLFFRNFGGRELAEAVGVVPCSTVIDGEVNDWDENPDDTWVVQAKSDPTLRALLNTNILTGGNLDEARHHSHRFLTEDILVVGEEAVAAFFREATAHNQNGRLGAKQRRKLAGEAHETLKAWGFNIGS